jgi:hypothetical protein
MSVYFNYTRGSQWADSGSILLPQSARRIGANEMAPRSAGGVGVFAHRLDGEIDKIPKTRTPPGTASAFSRMDRKGLTVTVINSQNIIGLWYPAVCMYTQ